MFWCLEKRNRVKKAAGRDDGQDATPKRQILLAQRASAPPASNERIQRTAFWRREKTMRRVSVLQVLGMVFLQPSNNFAVQLRGGLNCQFKLLLRDIACRVVTGHVTLPRESLHLLDHLRISFDGQFERLNRLYMVPELS